MAHPMLSWLTILHETTTQKAHQMVRDHYSPRVQHTHKASDAEVLFDVKLLSLDALWTVSDGVWHFI